MKAHLTLAALLMVPVGAALAAEPENAREIREGFEPMLPAIQQDIIREKGMTRFLREPDETSADSDVAIVRTLFRGLEPTIERERRPAVSDPRPDAIEIHGGTLALERVLDLIARATGHQVSFASPEAAAAEVHIPSGRFSMDLLLTSLEEQSGAAIHHYPEGRTFIVTASASTRKR